MERAFMILVFVFILFTSCTIRQEQVVLLPTSPWQDSVLYIPSTYCGVPTDILDRLIQSESSWNIHAINKSSYEHSVGLAQINMKWIHYFREKYGLQDPTKPSEAIHFAARYLYDLYKETGSWYEAVLAYKCGLNGRYIAPKQIRLISIWIVYGDEP